MDLQDKIAVVTGASSGIGRSIAKELSAKGCKVVLASRTVEEMKRVQNELTTESLVVEMDVRQTKSVHDAFLKITQQFSRIDILVNCAGVMPLTYLKNLHLEEWLETIEVNVKGCLRCIYEVIPFMKSQESGHIINIASVDGKELFEGGAIYGASKAAVIALSRAMRMELSPNFNIRVTAIEPGTVDTDLREDITDQELLEDKNYGGDEPKLKAEHISNAVIYSLTQPEEVNVNEILVKPTGKA